MRGFRIIALQFLLIPLFFTYAQAWDCFTHAYIAKKAGLRIPEAACMPDIIRDEQYDLFEPLHYHSAPPDAIITAEYVDKFKIAEKTVTINGKNYRLRVPDPAGVLYYKIVELYEKMKALDRRNHDNLLALEYYLFTIAHYIGDLSQPLHNFPYGEKVASDGRVYAQEGKFNREFHDRFDQAFTELLRRDPLLDQEIEKSLKTIRIENSETLKEEIAKIASSAQKIARACFTEKRLPTKEELVLQVSSSISLLRAIVESIKR